MLRNRWVSPLSAGLTVPRWCSTSSPPLVPPPPVVSSSSTSVQQFWLRKLGAVRRPSARSLLPQLVHTNPLGFVPAALARTAAESQPVWRPARSSLGRFVLDAKSAHADKIVLVRVGEFYEAFGIDAVMLVEHCGLNPMGGRPRAGCPWRNVQSTLDGLTSSGLSVAVYEELDALSPGLAGASEYKAAHTRYASGAGAGAVMPGEDAAAVNNGGSSGGRGGGGGAGIKQRFLSQLVTPARSTYLYDLAMRPGQLLHEAGDTGTDGGGSGAVAVAHGSRDDRPFVGIAAVPRGGGYQLIEAHLGRRELVVHERLSEEGVLAALAALEGGGWARPLYVQYDSAPVYPMETARGGAGAAVGAGSSAGERASQRFLMSLASADAGMGRRQPLGHDVNGNMNTDVDHTGGVGAGAVVRSRALMWGAHEAEADAVVLQGFPTTLARSSAAPATSTASSVTVDSMGHTFAAAVLARAKVVGGLSSASCPSAENGTDSSTGTATDGKWDGPAAPWHSLPSAARSLNDHFRMLCPQEHCTGAHSERRWHPRPLHVATAAQLGLLPTSHAAAIGGVAPLVPSLVTVAGAGAAVTRSCPAASARFLQRWLLVPPPLALADTMAVACRALAGSGGTDDIHGDGANVAAVPLPPTRCLAPAGKLTSLLAARQANAPLLRDVYALLSTLATALGADEDAVNLQSPVARALLPIVMREACLPLPPSFGEGAIRAQRDENHSDASEDVAMVEAQRRLGSDAARGAEELRGVLVLSPADAAGEAADSARRAASAGVARALSENPQLELLKCPSEVTRLVERGWSTWRGMVQDDYPGVTAPTARVQRAAEELVAAVLIDFGPSLATEGAQLSFDVANNTLVLRRTRARKQQKGTKDTDSVASASTEVSHDGEVALVAHGGEAANDTVVSAPEPAWMTPLDRHAKPMTGRRTTPRVRDAVDAFNAANVDARTVTRAVLEELCSSLVLRLPTVLAALHWGIVGHAITAHAAAALRNGWALPRLEGVKGSAHAGDRVSDSSAEDEEDDDKRFPFRLRQLTPYWLPRQPSTDGELSHPWPQDAPQASHFHATPNDLDLDGIFLLTAPNTAGKSTLLRATLAAALLANAGLFAPVASSSQVPRFDGFYLRTASATSDAPTVGLSGFAAELDEARAVLRDASAHSLVAIDEIGRATSSRDGAALAAAVLEHLASLGTHVKATDDVGRSGEGVRAIFSTHLHHELRVLRRNGALQVRFADNENGDLNHAEGKANGAIVRLKTLGMQPLPGSGVDMDAAPKFSYRLTDGECTDSLGLRAAARAGLPAPMLRRAAALGQFLDHLDAQQEALQVDIENVNKLALVETDGEDCTKIQTGSVRDDESAVIGAADDVSDRTALPKPPVTLEIALDTLKDSAAATAPASRGQAAVEVAGIVPHDWMPPPALETSACVYVLQLVPRAAQRVAAGTTEGVSYYVGETESIRQRLLQHRQAFLRGAAPQYDKLHCAVLQVQNKSAARAAEAAAITALRARGFPLRSDHDSGHVHFSSSSR